MRILKSGLFGRGVEDTRIDQSGENGIKVVFKIVFCGNGFTDVVKTKLVIDSLQEKVTAVKAPLCIIRQILNRGKVDGDRRSPLLFGAVEKFHLLTGPGFCISNAIGIADIFFRTKLFYNEGFIFTIDVNCFLSIIGYGIL